MGTKLALSLVVLLNFVLFKQSYCAQFGRGTGHVLSKSTEVPFAVTADVFRIMKILEDLEKTDSDRREDTNSPGSLAESSNAKKSRRKRGLLDDWEFSTYPYGNGLDCDDHSHGKATALECMFPYLVAAVPPVVGAVGLKKFLTHLKNYKLLKIHRKLTLPFVLKHHLLRPHLHILYHLLKL